MPVYPASASSGRCEHYFKEQNKDWVADRTKRIVDALKRAFVAQAEGPKDFTEENLVKAIEVAVSSLGSKKKIKVDKERKTDVLLFLSPGEIDSLERIITESYRRTPQGKTFGRSCEEPE